MNEVKQSRNFKIEQIVMSVEELVYNTEPDVFDPLTFEGYQRKIVDSHCEKIVDYILEKEFFFPSPIICSTRENKKNPQKMWIVDGQHRIEAFKILKESDNPLYKRKYDEIKYYTIPVIKLINPDVNDEISTFITINKTGRKVDTSLAQILNNKISSSQNKDEMKRAAKIDYLCVELAKRVNEKELSMWTDQISFEDNPRKEGKLISLNAFIKAERTLISKLEKKGLLIFDWTNDLVALEKSISLLEKSFSIKWNTIEKKWAALFNGNIESRSVLQGPIGCSSINKFIGAKLIQNPNIISFDDFLNYEVQWINGLKISYENWIKGKYYSRYSSESGYSFIARDLEKNCFV